MESFLTEEQLDYCWNAANKVAKEILDKDISDMFGEEFGNANYALEVAAMFSSGIIAIIAEMINFDSETVADTFNERVKSLMNQKRKSSRKKLRIIQ